MIHPVDTSLNFDDVTIHQVLSVVCLGVRLYSELCMRNQVNCVACSRVLLRVRQLRNVIELFAFQRVVSALVLSRFDYCNAILAGVPASTLAPLQRVLNAAVRLVASLGPLDHITSALCAL
jgi:hypothetical protein